MPTQQQIDEYLGMLQQKQIDAALFNLYNNKMEQQEKKKAPEEPTLTYDELKAKLVEAGKKNAKLVNENGALRQENKALKAEIEEIKAA